MSHIVVLGAGPTGLFAAHAAAEAGHDVRILSKGARRSYMNGAQYLHKPIPGLTGDPFEITYDLEGAAAGYRRKVYGADSAVDVSVESLVGKAQAWDVRAAYDQAWAIYGDVVAPWEANNEPEQWRFDADLVISTIPRTLMCDVGHSFTSEDVWATNRIMYPEALPPALDDLVVCSGNVWDRWYRQSRIRGHENTEWPIDVFATDKSLRTGDPLWRVVKPIATDCTCNPEFLHVGRYGEWKKGVLAHSGYYDTLAAL